MRIHSNTLTEQDIHRAARAGGMHGVYVTDIRPGGSRSRTRRFDVTLRGTSSRRPNSGNRGAAGGSAASWDEWGIFINALFQADPDAIVGQYPDYETFRDVTFCRFDDATALLTTCTKVTHKWVSDGYGINQCKWCGAQFNWGDLLR